MTRYQLGTAVVAASETVVVAFDGMVFPLATVLALAEQGTIRSVPPVSDMLDAWSAWRHRIAAAVERAAGDGASRLTEAGPLAPGNLRWLPPVRAPRKLICLGENYGDHASEMEGSPLEFPYAFLKPPSTTLRGSGETVRLLEAAKQNDWEIELAVIMGAVARNVAEADALRCVAGYSIINDVSARDWIAERDPHLGIDWVMQKAPDGYAPMGPFLTPAEFVPDPQRLAMTLTVNGEVMQEGNTADMVFGVAKVIAHLSRFMTLEPGDVISTGTPGGTGYGRRPQVFLKDGDLVRATIAGLGTLENSFESGAAGREARVPPNAAGRGPYPVGRGAAGG